MFPFCCPFAMGYMVAAAQAMAVYRATANPQAARKRHMREINKMYRPGSKKWRAARRHSENIVQSYYHNRRPR